MRHNRNSGKVGEVCLWGQQDPSPFSFPLLFSSWSHFLPDQSTLFGPHCLLPRFLNFLLTGPLVTNHISSNPISIPNPTGAFENTNMTLSLLSLIHLDVFPLISWQS